MEKTEVILPKGTIVKLEGLPYELLAEVKAEGCRLRGIGGAANGPAAPLANDHSEVTLS